MGQVTAEVFERSDGRWAWRLRAENGQTVAADGNQGFRDSTDAQRAVSDVITSIRADTAITLRVEGQTRGIV